MTYELRRCTPVSDSVTWIACTAAGTTEVVLVALIIGLITKDSSAPSSINGVAWAASIVHILALLLLPVTVFLYLRRSPAVGQNVAGATSILLTTLAVLLSIYSLTQFWHDKQLNDNDEVDQSTIRGLCQAGFVLWTATVVLHMMVYAILFWPDNHKDWSSSTDDSTSRDSHTRSLKQPINVQLTVLSPPAAYFSHHPKQPMPPVSAQHSSPRSSIRYSMDNVIRPMTSKTKLLLQKARDSYSLHSDRKTSLDTIGQEDDFGDWDTCGPDDIPELYPRPSVRSRLETIPGSRPVSSARPLDEPFDEQEDIHTHEDYLPESIIQAALNSPSSETSSIRFSRRSLQSNADQAHIHPLFRSESPAPAPAVSAGTYIYSSPYGGQRLPPDSDVVLPRKLSSAQSHRAESPSPLPPGRSRQSSFHSLRFQSSPPPIEPFILARPSPPFASSPDGYS